jgi:hypothetical protein
MCLSELEMLLKKFGKFLIAFDKPRDSEILKRLFKVINKAQSESLDIEEKSMIPCTFEGICQTYSKNMSILVELYEIKFASFIKKEILSGKPIVKKDGKKN